MNLEEIKIKLDKLEEVKIKLKEKFIGIDTIIDQFIDSAKIWYAAPELQIRPLIVNLWGLTGVGKTDLIRTFVNLIGFNDNFVELQMDNLNDGSYHSTIQSKLEDALDDTSKSAILLLDEMQRFRTIDELGADLPKSETDKLSDVWTLLSDGKFSRDISRKNELISLFYDVYLEISEKITEGNTPVKPKKTNKKTEQIEVDTVNKNINDEGMYYWRAKRVKKILNLTESLTDVMLWDRNKLLNELSSAIKCNKIYEGSCYSKLLIIISGNLDEAYKLSGESDNSDVDADFYHEHSKKITLIDIKRALSYRFKPEQIARFGNTHLIYPSLSKKSYLDIIKLKCDYLKNTVLLNTGIDVSFDKTVYDVIYRNGVFPTQGVRPVLSTISSILENSIPYFIYNSLLKNTKIISIKFTDEHLTSNIGGEIIKYKVNTTIDNIKKGNSLNKEALIAVHEVGHTIAYMALFGVTPIQLLCSTASAYTGGFLTPHQTENSKNILLNDIIVLLSGRAAEKIIFGDGLVTSGASSDIERATTIASSYVRKYGMASPFEGNVIVTSVKEPSYGILETDETNKIINDILGKCRGESENIINNNLELLKKLTLSLIENKKLNSEEIYNISREYYPNLKVEETSHVIGEDYIGILNKKFSEL